MIETPRTLLRPWHEEDAESLFKYASSPEIGPIAGWAPHKSVEESRKIINSVFSAPEVYAIVLKSTDEPIGCCGIMPVNGEQTLTAESAEGEVGYWLGAPYWSQGLMTEAVTALIDHAFTNLKFTTMWCTFAHGNDRSRRVCEKCGFTFLRTDNDVESPLGDLRTIHTYRLPKHLTA